MTTPEDIMNTIDSTTAVGTTAPGAANGSRRPARIVGIVITVVVAAFLVFDVAGKLARPQAVVDSMESLGFPLGQATVMGIVLAVCLIVFLIPRTAVLGALGLTAYLGGAVTANMRIESPVFSSTLFAVYLGVLLWIGLVLRRPELLVVLGLRRRN